MRIAVAQTPGARLDQWRATRTLLDDLIRQAAGLQARLVVLPECAWPAYCLGSRRAYDAARIAGLPAPAEFLQHLQQIARDLHIAICAGHVAEHGGRLLNAASLIDAGGRLCGTRHKCFLWDFDHDYFEPGERIEPIDTDFGRTGVLICADARLPEIPATLAARGAELFLQPTAWVNAGTATAPWNPQPEFLIAARAAEFGVPIASASKWGVEGDTAFVGGSLICDAAGQVVARCGPAETMVRAAEVERSRARSLHLTDEERAALQSADAPEPTRAAVGPLELVLVPPGEDAAAEWSRAPTAGAEARLVIQPGGTDTNAHTSQLIDKRKILIGGPLPDVVDLQGVRIGAVSALAATRFAPIRCLVLRGVHLVVVFGGAASPGQFQTRACENRIFLLQVSDQNWRVIAPTGIPFASAAGARWQQPVTVRLDPRAAVEKLVASRTDVVADRRPRQYVL